MAAQRHNIIHERKGSGEHLKHERRREIVLFTRKEQSNIVLFHSDPAIPAAAVQSGGIPHNSDPLILLFRKASLKTQLKPAKIRNLWIIGLDLLISLLNF